MPRRQLISAIVLCVFATAATAFEIEYAQDRQAPLVQCDETLYSGDATGARECFLALVDANDDPRIKGDASRRLGELQAANSYFQSAIQQFPDDAQLRTRWGELFLVSHENNEAF